MKGSARSVSKSNPNCGVEIPRAKWGPTEAKPSVYVAPRAPNANHLTRVSITAMTKLGKGLDSTCCGRTSCTSHPYRYRSGKLETGNSREPYLHTRLCWQLAMPSFTKNHGLGAEISETYSQILLCSPVSEVRVTLDTSSACLFGQVAAEIR
jgi:hypothetical protein